MQAAHSGIMEEMTWEEVRDAAAANTPIILAIGSTEQHGPHLPLATDCILPQGIAREVAKRLPLVVAPPIRYGAKSRALSGGGETFPGTISLRGTTLLAELQDVLEALARSGFRQICLQNWHYENAGFLWEAADLAVQKHSDVRILIVENPMPSFSEDELRQLFPKGFPGWDVEHASIMETSMMMVLYPQFVHLDRIVDDEAQRHPTWDVVPAPPEFVPRSGVLWHPSEATDDIGRRFIAAAVDRLEEALRTEFTF